VATLVVEGADTKHKGGTKWEGGKGSGWGFGWAKYVGVLHGGRPQTPPTFGSGLWDSDIWTSPDIFW
jgi:hypothetical protein